MSRKSFEGSFIFHFTTSTDLVLSFVMLKEGFKVISETKRNIQRLSRFFNKNLLLGKLKSHFLFQVSFCVRAAIIRKESSELRI